MQLALPLFDEIALRPVPREYVVLDTPDLTNDDHITTPDLTSYDQIIVAFSGGKDSIASVLCLLDEGVPPEKIELWHHDIDGCEGSHLMDWPVTRAYCRAFANTFSLPIFFSWKVGGFAGEMLRDNAPTAPSRFETPAGDTMQIGGDSAKRGTRLRFPQVAANLSVRWCSAYLKIDVAAKALNHQDRFLGTRTLFVTGERAEESPCRARYATFEAHRTDKRASPKLKRHVDHWRPVHSISTAEVWALLKRYRINPNPAYRLGWGRVSCAGCIFGSPDQWASLRSVNPAQFQQIAAYEQRFGVTIRRDSTITEAADRGTPYAAINPVDVAAALAHEWREPIIIPPDQPWTLPAGAFGDMAGPT